MKLFGAYIRQHRGNILIFISFCAVFFAVFALYRLPFDAVLYPTLLCLLAGAVYVAVDFLRVKVKHSQLCKIKELTASMISSLPDAKSVTERDYQDIIAGLKAETAELESKSYAGYRDMVEYYTVWAHQIKTPITSMRLTLQNEDTPFSRKLSSDLFQIEQYVEMVLTFLRLDSPSADYVFKEHSIDSIVKQSVAKFSSEFIDRRLRLCYEETAVTVTTDDKWLAFVIEQVLSNALKYTHEGSISIYMCAPKTLCIEDTGIGIASPDLPRIFEKGFTGYNGRTDKNASGLGLYLCKRVCDNLGILIDVTSKPGSGTTVHLNLEQYDLKA